MAGNLNVAGRADPHPAVITLRPKSWVAGRRGVDVEPCIAVKDRHGAVACGWRQHWSRDWRRQDDRADRIDDAAFVAWSKRNPVRLVLEWRRDIDSGGGVAGRGHANRARHVRA